jgi:hypothetical protein
VDPAPAASDYRFAEADLSIEATDRADDGVLDAFFGAYDAAFVLANEKEEIDGFRACLALNRGAQQDALRARYGPFRELVLVARDRAMSVVGGANFIVIQHPPDAAYGVGHTVNLNYLFVAPAARGKRHSLTLLIACRRLADTIAAQWHVDTSSKSLVFLEVNDPFRLTPEQYRLDSEHAGIDQVARLAYWARLGAAVLDWPYVQPALSHSQDDDRTLAYAMLDANTRTLPAALLLWHLQRFFAISVLKGARLESNATALDQVQRLQRDAAAQCTLRVLDLAAALEGLPALVQRTRDRPSSLIAALGGATA